MSLLPAHPRRNGGADDQRPTGDARADGERPATGTPNSETGQNAQNAQNAQTGQPTAGRSAERPRYAFAYAPPDDMPEENPRDKGPRDREPRDGDSPGRHRAGNDLPRSNVVAGNVVAGNVVAGDAADEREDRETAVTRPNPIPGRIVTGDAADAHGDDEPAVTRPSPIPGRASPPAAGNPAAPVAPAPPTSAAPVPPTVPVATAAPPTVETPVTAMNRSAPGGDGTPVPAPRAATEREAPGQDSAGQDSAGQDSAGQDTAGLDEPLLTNAAALRARWQRAQLDFVDDPRAAVGDAADLVAQTAQAMIDALEQRQRLLRQEWERDKQREHRRRSGQGNGSVLGDPGDTERLRLTMRAYRALFNQICAQ